MVGFTDLSDTDESLIDEIISQAQDACVLDQIVAINCSSFTDSVLPTHLESRFRNLKSLPPNRTSTTTPPPSFSKAHSFSISHSSSPHFSHLGTHRVPHFSPPEVEDPVENTSLDPKSQSGSLSQLGSVSSPPLKGNSDDKNGLKEKSKLGSGSDESSISSLFKPKPEEEEEKRRKLKQKSGSLSSPLSNSNSFMSSSPSPPRKAGCFWCSPKKDLSSKKKKKSKENWGIGWDKSDEEFLSDLGSFSSKKQQKILKMAMKEEERVSMEAEKIVQWAKQASARMSVLDIDDDELSDH